MLTMFPNPNKCAKRRLKARRVTQRSTASTLKKWMTCKEPTTTSNWTTVRLASTMASTAQARRLIHYRT